MNNVNTIFGLSFMLIPLLTVGQTHSNMRVFPNNPLQRVSQTEVSIAVSPIDQNRFLIGANTVDGMNKRQGYYYSTDGGVSWNGSNVLPWGLLSDNADPSVAFDRLGNAFFCFLGTQVSRDGIRVLVAKSSDGGQTWPTVPKKIPGTLGEPPDKPFLTVDTYASSTYANRIYVVYTSRSFNIQFSASTDHGENWSPNVTISGTVRSQNAIPVVGPDGTVYVFWSIMPDGHRVESIGFNKSTDGGQTFRGPSTILSVTQIGSLVGEHYRLKITPSNPEGVRVDSYPSAAVNASGHIYLVWSDQRADAPGSGTPDILLVKSTDQGTTWSTPVRLNNLPHGDQWCPWVCVEQDGTVDVVFYDSRSDPRNLQTNAYLAKSTDGGSTFANYLLSDTSFVPVPVPYTSPGYMGDYLGIVASSAGVLPVWSDTRFDQVYQVFTSVTKVPIVTLVHQQLQGTSTEVGDVGRWNGISFEPRFVTPNPIAVVPNAIEILHATPSVFQGQKYNLWDDNPDVRNHHLFVVRENIDRYNSNLKPTDPTITIKTDLIDLPGTAGGDIQFRDPWYIDYQDPQYGNNWRNRGMQGALFHDRPSPFYPNYDTVYLGSIHPYRGVFLNENEQFDPNKPYYSVGAPQPNTFTIGGNNYQAYFQNWEGTSVRYQNANAAQTGVVFTSSNATATAKYKLHLASSSANVTASNTQRKIVRDFSGQLHMVYESAGLIWYTHKYNGHQNWEPEKLVSTIFEGYPEYVLYRDPSIIYVPRVAAGDGGGDGEEPAAQEHRIRIVWEAYSENQLARGIFICELNLDGELTYGPELLHSWSGLGNPARPVLAVTPDYVDPHYPPAAYHTLVAWYESSMDALLCVHWPPNNHWDSIGPLAQGVTEFSLAPYSSTQNTWHLGYIENNAVKYMPVFVASPPQAGTPETIVVEDDAAYVQQPCITAVHPTSWDNGDTLGVTWQTQYWEFATTAIKYSERVAEGSWTYPASWTPRYEATYEKPTIIGNPQNMNALLAWQSESPSLYVVQGRAGNWVTVSSLGSGADPTLSASSSDNATEYLLSRGVSQPYIIQQQQVSYSGAGGGNGMVASAEGRSAKLMFNRGMLHMGVLEAQVDGAAIAFVAANDTASITLQQFENVFATEPFSGSGTLNLRVLFTAKGSLPNGISLRLTLRDAASGRVLQNLRTFRIGDDTLVTVQASLDHGNRQVRLVLQPVGVTQVREMGLERWYVVDEESRKPLAKGAQTEVSLSPLPAEFAVHPNYPNPFNPATTIRYDLPEASHVSLVVYDVLGRKVAELVDGMQDAGFKSVEWNAASVASGVYLARFTAMDANGSVKLAKVMKLVLAK